MGSVRGNETNLSLGKKERCSRDLSTRHIMKFKIVTLGCKVNTYESVFMKEELIKAGYHEEEPADIIIINTCSVTNVADNKSKKVIRHEKRNNPQAIIVVCGCSAENNREKLNDLGINTETSFFFLSSFISKYFLFGLKT